MVSVIDSIRFVVVRSPRATGAKALVWSSLPSFILTIEPEKAIQRFLSMRALGGVKSLLCSSGPRRFTWPSIPPKSRSRIGSPRLPPFCRTSSFVVVGMGAAKD